MTRHIVLVAHNIRSLWNVGSFFRTADAFAVEKVYLTGYTGTPPRKEISKTSLGADEWLPWEHADDPATVLRALKADGWTIAALELTPDAIDIATYAPPEKLCLVLGHEVTGVSDDLIGLCDVALQIPMLGKKESLNVAVATGVALHRLRTA
jgi:23S rRNA (guanosine2251-2'-O)-methyltransferase